ncbi:hypothetical protein D3C80_1134800 [compost metagenome]
MDVQGHRPKRRIAGLFEDDRLLDVAQAQPAHLTRGMRSQQAVFTGALDQHLAQLGRRTVGCLARVALQGDDDVSNELPYFGLQGSQLGRQGEMHGGIP